jgi:2-isopropylmalate synthase
MASDLDLTPTPHDWNTRWPVQRAVHVVDSTLLDALHAPSGIDADVSAKVGLLYASATLGVQALVLGRPGAGPRHRRDVLTLAHELSRAAMPIDVLAAAHARIEEVSAVMDIRERAGLDIELALTLPASPILHQAMGLTLDRLRDAAERSVAFAVRSGARVQVALDDAARTPPALLAVLVQHLVALGTTAIVLRDSAGALTPQGTRRMVRHVHDVVLDITDARVRLSFSGHRDRGMAVANALAAYEAGAQRVEASALGLGEGTGQVELEALLANLYMLGAWPHGIDSLRDYVHTVAEAFNVQLAPTSTVSGDDAFRVTASTRATALAGAWLASDRFLAERVTSAVPAGAVGAAPELVIGPTSGFAAVRWWMVERGYDPRDVLLARELLLAVQRAERVLTDDELHGLATELLATRMTRTGARV